MGVGVGKGRGGREGEREREREREREKEREYVCECVCLHPHIQITYTHTRTHIIYKPAVEPLAVVLVAIGIHMFALTVHAIVDPVSHVSRAIRKHHAPEAVPLAPLPIALHERERCLQSRRQRIGPLFPDAASRML